MAARDHVGTVVLPTMIGELDLELVQLPTEAKAPTRDIWMIVYPDIRRSPMVEMVMDFLVDCIERDPRLAISMHLN
jgi:DNA-binding transcriptional LysR family regulator